MTLRQASLLTVCLPMALSLGCATTGSDGDCGEKCDFIGPISPWSTPVATHLLGGTDRFKEISLTLDASGTPHIADTTPLRPTDLEGTVFYQRLKPDLKWSDPTPVSSVGAGGRATEIQLIADKAGNTHLIHDEPFFHTLRVALGRGVNRTWSVQEFGPVTRFDATRAADGSTIIAADLPTGLTYGVVQAGATQILGEEKIAFGERTECDPQLAVSPAGGVYVAYCGRAGADGGRPLFVAKRTGVNTWMGRQVATLASIGTQAGDFDIAVDRAEMIHLVFTASDGLAYTQFPAGGTPSSGDKLPVEPLYVNNADPMLKLGRDGGPHIIYNGIAQGFPTTQLIHSFKTTSGWVHERVTEMSYGFSFDIDMESDAIHLAVVGSASRPGDAMPVPRPAILYFVKGKPRTPAAPQEGGGAAANPCAQNNGGCAAKATCAASGATVTCSCPRGYQGDGKTYTDIDECATMNGGCSAESVCKNEEGSRSCTCKMGYKDDGMMACVDIDECASANGGCDSRAICTNTPGSNTCACPPGMTGDGHTCTADSSSDPGSDDPGGFGPETPEPTTPPGGEPTEEMKPPGGCSTAAGGDRWSCLLALIALCALRRRKR